MQYVIYSHSEAVLGEAGFWNNETGWVNGQEEATRFDQPIISLPITSGSDARCIPVQDAT